MNECTGNEGIVKVKTNMEERGDGAVVDDSDKNGYNGNCTYNYEKSMK